MLSADSSDVRDRTAIGRHYRSMRELGLIPLLVLSVACGDDVPLDPESSTGMDTSTSSSSSAPMSSSTTQQPSSSTMETGEETSTGSEPGTTTTSTDPETGTSSSSGSDGTLEDACTAYCTTFLECEGSKGIEKCVDPCVASDASRGEACIDAAIAWYECMAVLSCEDLLSEACDEQEDVHYEACTQTCSVTLERGEECGATFACPDNDYEIACTETTCTCLENGAAVGECDADGICDVGDVSEYAAECCDFALD
jgi:hypothetical protein